MTADLTSDPHDRSGADRSERPDGHTFDAAYWNERYAAKETVWGRAPNRFVEEELDDVPPGRAVDLACGEGRNAIWLSGLGWQVTGLDYSAVALDKARADEQHTTGAQRIDWQVGDVTTFAPEAPVDLALVCYLQVDAQARRATLVRAAGSLAPGGILVVVAHHSRNLTHGTGGPQNPAALYTPVDVAADLDGTGLEIERADEVLRPVEGAPRPAIDLVVRARRPRS